MRYVHVRVREGRGTFYVAATEVTEVDLVLEEVVLRDGRRLKLVESEAVDQLLGGDLVRGVGLADGAMVTVPVTAIDRIEDRFDEASDGWVATVTTVGGSQFLVDAVGRTALGLDEGVCDFEVLREQAARLRGDTGADVAAEEAVDAAEKSAGGPQLFRVGSRFST